MEQHFILYFISNHHNTCQGQRDFMEHIRKYTQRDITGQKDDVRMDLPADDLIENLSFDYHMRIN